MRLPEKTLWSHSFEMSSFTVSWRMRQFATVCIKAEEPWALQPCMWSPWEQVSSRKVFGTQIRNVPRGEMQAETLTCKPSAVTEEPFCHRRIIATFCFPLCLLSIPAYRGRSDTLMNMHLYIHTYVWLWLDLLRSSLLSLTVSTC